MLPFLKKKNEASIAGVLIKQRTPDETPQEDQESDDPAAAIEACSAELIRAVHARDTKAVAEALKDAFQIMESMPHDEASESDEGQY